MTILANYQGNRTGRRRYGPIGPYRRPCPVIAGPHNRALARFRL